MTTTRSRLSLRYDLGRLGRMLALRFRPGHGMSETRASSRGTALCHQQEASHGSVYCYASACARMARASRLGTARRFVSGRLATAAPPGTGPTAPVRGREGFLVRRAHPRRAHRREGVGGSCSLPWTAIRTGDQQGVLGRTCLTSAVAECSLRPTPSLTTPSMAIPVCYASSRSAPMQQ